MLLQHITILYSVLKLAVSELIEEQRRGQPALFQDIAPFWLKSVRSQVSKARVDRYRMILQKYILPLLWNQRLDQIDSLCLQGHEQAIRPRGVYVFSLPRH